MKANGHRNKWGSGGQDSCRIRKSVFAVGNYIFTTVDTTNDLKALKVLGLKCPNLVNIQHHYKVWGSDKNKLNSLVDLASAIIDPC